MTEPDCCSPEVHQQIAPMEPRTSPESDSITFDDVVPLIPEMVLEAPLGLDLTKIDALQ